MAATKTSRNDTPNTPKVNESKIASMKVGELRRRLKDRGVAGTEDLKKPDLVKKLIKAEAKGTSAKKSTGKRSTATTSAAKKSTGKRPTATTSAAKQSTGKKSTAKTSSGVGSGGKKAASRNDTSTTLGAGESRIAAMKVDELRRELKSRGVKGTAGLKKADLVKKLMKASAAKSGSASKKSSAGGGKRTGKATSDSLKYSQEIRSTSDRPERPGRSLVTTDHDVIRQWAEERKAVPATVAGTEHSGHLGVLRLDFPGYSGDRLQEVSWDDWFEAFDKRRLNFIYQQKQSSGKPSNFFQLENPDQ
jgi:predicted HTH domain antitoxin